MVYDAIVIGGGPAGSTAARRLAAEGLAVLLLEAKAWPHVKPCGGALTTRAWPLLPRGYEGLVETSPSRFTFAGRGRGATVDVERPYCHTVQRVHFDRWLWDEAVAAGAEGHAGEVVVALALEPGGLFTVSTSRARYAARYVLGADGAKGPTAKWLGLRTVERGAALEVEGAVPAALYDRFQARCEVELAGTPWGYAWVIPKRPGVLNIGVGSFRPGTLRLKDRLHEYLDGVPVAGPILAHPLPFRWHRTSVVRGRAALIGDAAGLMDPFSAEGIFHAIQSAWWAADAVTRASVVGSGLEAYDEKLSRDLWPHHRQASQMARLVYPLAGLWTRVFLDDQDLIRRYLDVALDVSDYAALVAATRRSLWKTRGRALWGRGVPSSMA